MRIKIILLALTLFTFAKISFSQSGFPGNYDVSGTVRDQSGAALPGLLLDFEKQFAGRVERTDINGDFRATLHPGEYVVTAPELGSSSPKVFIKIVRNGPNLSRLDLVVDTSKMCSPIGPVITKKVNPPVPPAARAVRATGPVTVLVKVGSDGSIVSASAVSGHPLLRAASAQAARQFQYDPSSVKSETELTLSFIFLDGSVKKDGVERFQCDSRIIVNSQPILIQKSLNTFHRLSIFL